MEKKTLIVFIILLLIFMAAIILINAKAIKNYRIEEEEEYARIRRLRYTGMSQQEKDIYNATVHSYLYNDVKGSEVKSMIDAIISSNQACVGERGKFIGIRIKGTLKGVSEEESDNLKKACEQASIYNSQTGQMNENPTDNNTESNVKNATENMEKMKKKINSQSKYNVEGLMDQGIYTWIIISEAE